MIMKFIGKLTAFFLQIRSSVSGTNQWILSLSPRGFPSTAQK
jgi:hypothetical protein